MKHVFCLFVCFLHVYRQENSSGPLFYEQTNKQGIKLEFRKKKKKKKEKENRSTRIVVGINRMLFDPSKEFTEKRNITSKHFLVTTKIEIVIENYDHGTFFKNIEVR